MQNRPISVPIHGSESQSMQSAKRNRKRLLEHLLMPNPSLSCGPTLIRQATQEAKRTLHRFRNLNYGPMLLHRLDPLLWVARFSMSVLIRLCCRSLVFGNPKTILHCRLVKLSLPWLTRPNRTLYGLRLDRLQERMHLYWTRMQL